MAKVYEYRISMGRMLLWVSPMFFITLFLYDTLSYMAIFMIMIMILIFVVLGSLISTIKISSAGIQLYHFNKMAFKDIRSIKRINIIGLPYLKVKKNKGMSWSIPLYFSGEIPIKDALLISVPNELSVYEEIKSI